MNSPSPSTRSLDAIPEAAMHTINFKFLLIGGASLLSFVARRTFNQGSYPLGVSRPAQSAQVALNPSDFYVSSSGSDQNPGSLARPFKPAQKCAETIQLGRTCYLRAGTCRETIRPARSGSASASITFTAYQNETVTQRSAAG